jgi:hypothetical protein
MPVTAAHIETYGAETQPTGLALDACEARAVVDDQVVADVLAEGNRDGIACVVEASIATIADLSPIAFG